MCNICKILAQEITPPGGILFQNEWLFVSHATDVNIPGYLFVSSVRHVASHENLTDKEMDMIGRFTKRAIAAIKTIEGVDRVYVCSFCEETPHIHYHLFPRYHWMSDEKFPVRVTQKVDAPTLFNYFRLNYREQPEHLRHYSKILETAAHLQSELNQPLG